MRARIILLAADGVPSRQISQQVRMHESNVALWRHRFLAEGLAGLIDAPRSGRPPTYDPLDHLKVVAKATMQRDPDEPEATWTYAALSDALRDEVGISRSQLWRILDRPGSVIFETGGETETPPCRLRGPNAGGPPPCHVIAGGTRL